MSKCDISITFDRTDRVYRGGETVSGAIHILVNKDITCSGIKLTTLWKTHGRGNVARGTPFVKVLAESSQLFDGQEFEFPFSFTSDLHPVTYHGKLINVDHYVRVDVDIPWAIDPYAEEEYVLLPGEPPEGRFVRGGPITVLPDSTTATTMKVFGVVGLIFTVVLFFIFPCLAPIPISIALFFYMRAKLLAGRLGDVTLKFAYVTVSPGDTLPMEIAFTPQKSFSINAITLKLTAEEVAISGSGTKKSTHRHAVHSEVHTLESATTVQAGQLFQRQCMITLPESEAYSLDRSDNDIVWTATVQIDIPRFPDWKRSQILQYVPREFIDAAPSDASAIDERMAHRPPPLFPEAVVRESESPFPTPLPYGSREPANASFASEQNPTADAAEVDDEEDDFDEESQAEISAPVSQTTDPELLSLIDQINAADRYSGARAEMATNAQGIAYDAAIKIERIVSTFGSSGGDDYRDGKTITGKLVGGAQPVEIFTRNDTIDQINQLSRGDLWQTSVAVLQWDTLYDRLVLLEA